MTSKLALYNSALQVLGERRIASLTENRAPRRRMDTVWDGGAVRRCLSAGLWNFAMRTIEQTYNPSVEPAFGFRYAFDKPTDWVRTFMMASDEDFCSTLLGYEDQQAYWFHDLDTIYVRYVSDDTDYGGDLSLWPENFTEFVAHYFAWKAAMQTTANREERNAILNDGIRALRRAKATDAMDETTRWMPKGSWVRARGGHHSRRGDQGSGIIDNPVGGGGGGGGESDSGAWGGAWG